MAPILDQLAAAGNLAVSSPFSYAYQSVATFSIVKSAQGLVHTITIGNLSTPTLTVYDNASGPSGTKAAVFAPNATAVGSYRLDATLLNGITIDYVPVGVAPQVTVTYK